MVTPPLEKYMPPDDEVKYTAMKLPRNTCDAPKECPFTGHLANLELMKKYQVRKTHFSNICIFAVRLLIHLFMLQRKLISDESDFWRFICGLFLQGQGLSATAESELERLKLECKRSAQMAEQWKKMYENLHEFCVNELLDGDQGKGT